MVCMSVQENPRALLSGFTHEQTQTHTITCLLYHHVALRENWNIITRRIGGNRKRLYNRQT